MIVPRPIIGLLQIISPVVVSLVYIGIMSLLNDRTRLRLSALIAGTGSVYFGVSLGVWDTLFSLPMFWLAHRGLDAYRYVGVRWIFHAVWDVLQHLYGASVLPFIPLSSFGCAICDSGLAIWYLLGAPLPQLLRRPQPAL